MEETDIASRLITLLVKTSTNFFSLSVVALFTILFFVLLHFIFSKKDSDCEKNMETM